MTTRILDDFRKYDLSYYGNSLLPLVNTFMTTLQQEEHVYYSSELERVRKYESFNNTFASIQDVINKIHHRTFSDTNYRSLITDIQHLLNSVSDKLPDDISVADWFPQSTFSEDVEEDLSPKALSSLNNLLSNTHKLIIDLNTDTDFKNLITQLMVLTRELLSIHS